MSLQQGMLFLAAGFLLLLYDGVGAVLEHNDIRLVNTPEGQLCKGRLEIYHSTEFAKGWFAVCDRSFGDEERMVVCRHLGCSHSSPTRTIVASHGKWSGNMKALSKDCYGIETGLSSCTDKEKYTCDFQESDLVGIQCNKGYRAQEWLTVTLVSSIIAVLPLF